MSARRPGRAAVLLSLLAGLLLSLLLPAPAGAQELADPFPPGEPPRAWILVDTDRGVVLASSNEHAVLPPASTIKVMTALVALERLSLDASITVSAHAAGRPAIKIGMREGEVWPLPDVLHSVLMDSANDAAYALAEGAAGSIEAFAAAMQATASRLGMQDSTFADPAGLDDEVFSFRGGSRMSAYDLAIAASNALTVPEIVGTAQTLDYEFTGPDGVIHTLPNQNETFLTTYDGATGLKTGYTEQAGRNIVATATRGGRTMLAVVLSVYDTPGWAGALLDRGFATPVDAPGTGVVLPEPRVLTVDARRVALATLPAPLGARPQVAGVAATEVAGTVVGPPAAAAPAPSGEAGSRWWWLVGVAGVLAVGIVVVLRRRAVRRRRQLVRARALADARRRGSLHVIEEASPIGGSHVQVIGRGRD